MNSYIIGFKVLGRNCNLLLIIVKLCDEMIREIKKFVKLNWKIRMYGGKGGQPKRGRIYKSCSVLKSCKLCVFNMYDCYSDDFLSMYAI